MALTRGPLLRRADRPIPDQRKAERASCTIRSYLFDAAGVASSATILDRSAAGVRVACTEDGVHQRASYILRLDSGAAYALRLAWYAGHVAGYEFVRRVDGAPDGRDRAVDAVRTAWLEHQLAESGSGR